MLEVGLVFRIINNLSLNCVQNALHICYIQNALTYFVIKRSMAPKKQQNGKLWCDRPNQCTHSLNPSCPRNCSGPVSSSAAFSGTCRDRDNQFWKQRELEQYKLAATKVPQSVPKNALFLEQFHLCTEWANRNAVLSTNPTPATADCPITQKYLKQEVKIGAGFSVFT